MLALVAAVGYGVSDFVGGVASRRIAALRFVVASYPLSLLLVLAVAPLVGGEITLSSLAWGAVAGVAGGVAIWWFYQALAEGPMSVVSPVTALLVAGIPVLVGLVLGERPGPLAYAGIALALLAVVLVSRESDEDVGGSAHPRFTARVAWLTFASGLTFALMFVAMNQVPEGTGLWPLAMARLTASVVVGAVALGAGMLLRPPRQLWPFIAGVAVLDVVANAALMFAFQHGMLSMVSVIGALYPAATVLLATTVLGERVGPDRRIGMVLAVAAVAMITFAS
ncbi:DMT family transporter [Rhodococcus sp. HM1]|uniref:DMT family transporter n=1 Tax=unclassified Rhodococcus (in: high G+C Gram-positive bacteria) TaxID=192944 RepID=UPI0018CD5698|nr:MULTISPECIES: DMT family transporter [unclassified Rhodococcus (in: high G+C Gram-positive bacteria)]MBH0121891.1 DMT family transporter [Rhodococcus sp. CX]MCK8670322.1 DMT family transporter [Rhodococcus sp. HM1]